MKILVFSDSHGRPEKMNDIIKADKDVDMVIHLGDLVRDAEYISDMNPDLSVKCVSGNNDWFSDEPREKTLVLGSKRFFITHGNLYGVKRGLDELINKGKEVNADIVLFGHTHTPYESCEGKTIILNPGSISMPYNFPEPTYSIVEISGDKIYTSIVKC
jgi:putative phosphoesterase